MTSLGKKEVSLNFNSQLPGLKPVTAGTIAAKERL